MCSGARDARFRGEATILERLWIIVQKINNVIEDFRWEVSICHRGFSSRSLTLVSGRVRSSNSITEKAG